jgi:hypothetical protein
VPIPVPQYLSSEWSFAQYRVPGPHHQRQRQLQAAAHSAAAGNGAAAAQPPAAAAQQHQAAPAAPAAAAQQQAPQQQHSSAGGGGPGRIIVGFSPAELHTLIIVTQAGGYFKVGFDPVKGGACTQLAASDFAPWLAGDGDGGELGGEAVLV